MKIEKTEVKDELIVRINRNELQNALIASFNCLNMSKVGKDWPKAKETIKNLLINFYELPF